jgi:hypothetical protein
MGNGYEIAFYDDDLIFDGKPGDVVLPSCKRRAANRVWCLWRVRLWTPDVDKVYCDDGVVAVLRGGRVRLRDDRGEMRCWYA